MKYFLKCLIASIILTLLLVPLRLKGLGIDYSSLVGFIAFFYLTFYLLKNYSKKLGVLNVILAILFGQLILFPDVIYLFFKGQLWFLPQFIIQTVGIICGFLYLRLKSPQNLIPFLIGCTFTVFMFYQGYDYWLHKRNFGTFTGKVLAFNLPTKFESFNEQKNLITDEDFRNKIVLLDFWHTKCGICFQKFPQVQTIYEKYKNDDSVMILAVNKPIEEDKPNQAFEVIKEEGYSFPVVITKDEDLAEKFGVKGYPTTFVINRNGQIVYKGNIEGAVKMVDEMKEKR